MNDSSNFITPTPYKTPKNIDSKANNPSTSRSLVYICSPFSGDTKGNIEKARKYCRFAVDNGYIPIAPHLLFPQFMNDNDEKERNLAMYMDIVLLSKCSELWVFGSIISKGMSIEIEEAKTKNHTIRYFNDTLTEVTK